MKKILGFFYRIERIPMTCDNEDVYYCTTVYFNTFYGCSHFEPRK